MTEHANSGGWSRGRVLLAVAMALFLGGLLGVGYRESVVQLQARELQQASARGIVDAILLRYHWEKWETNPHHKPFLDDLSRSLENQQYQWSIIRPHSDSQREPHSEFETTALANFPRKIDSNGATTTFVDRIVAQDDGKSFYEYLQPVYVKKNCIHCHNTLEGVDNAQVAAGLNEGDLMAVVKVVLKVER